MEALKNSLIEKVGDFPYRVVYPTPEVITTAGFGRVAGLPFVIDHRPCYHREANRFLIDVGLGEWDIATRGREEKSGPPPTPVTMHDYAHWLVNFLEYCHRRGKDPLKVEYMVDVFQGYQAEMLSGSWSRDNRPLAEKTVNCRVEIACMFQYWAVDKGLREQFRVPKVRRTLGIRNSRGSGVMRVKTVQSRKGKPRASKRRLGLPEEVLIGAWLSRLYQKSSTQGLIAETILETAIRRAEAAAWRVDTLPLDPAEWQVVNNDRPIENQSVLVAIKYGTKGPQYGADHGDKVGPKATIHVPMPLALKLHEYRRKVRPKALTILLRTAENARQAKQLREDAVHLFLNPETGQRYAGQQIYDFWTAPDISCPKGWHPHLARDFWACSLLWRHITEHRDLIEKATEKNADPSVLRVLTLDLEGFIERSIKPQLRHVDQDTTQTYLQWVSDKLHINLNLSERYMEIISEEDVGGEAR